MDIQKRIAVARGEHPADLAITGAQVFNVFTGCFEHKDVLITDGYIAALHSPGNDAATKAAETVDASSQWLVPGFIDAHVHIESSMVSPEEFCTLAAINGVTTLVADPHEITNILGATGIRYMLDATEKAAARVLFMLPSCVPASPLGQAAATISASDLRPFLGHPRILGLAEMMNYPGVVHSSPDVMEKLNAIHTYNKDHFAALRGLSIDGHAPFLTGADLQAYAAAGVASDHEASTEEEARERLAAGICLMMREGSAVKNLLDLVPAVTEHTAPFCMLCTDDRHPEDLIAQGSINYLVRKLVEDRRITLETILKLASYNAARHFSLKDTGAIAPGYRADCALYPNLHDWKPVQVWNNGECVARNGVHTQAVVKTTADTLRGRVILADTVSINSLHVADTGTPVNVIEVIPHQLITKKIHARLPACQGALLADPQQDIAKLAVFERHKGTGRVGVSFIKGMGLTQGAVASTVAHDSHNLVVMGMNNDDMFIAVRALQKAGGGLAVVSGGDVLALLPLPLAGIFSDKSAIDVCNGVREIGDAVRSLGVAPGNAPFMTLAFMTLDVIPSLKLTDSGLVDVDNFVFTSIYAE